MHLAFKIGMSILAGAVIFRLGFNVGISEYLPWIQVIMGIVLVVLLILLWIVPSKVKSK